LAFGVHRHVYRPLRVVSQDVAGQEVEADVDAAAGVLGESFSLKGGASLAWVVVREEAKAIMPLLLARQAHDSAGNKLERAARTAKDVLHEKDQAGAEIAGQFFGGKGKGILLQ
jgi:hypothetical protein